MKFFILFLLVQITASFTLANEPALNLGSYTCGSDLPQGYRGFDVQFNSNKVQIKFRGVDTLLEGIYSSDDGEYFYFTPITSAYSYNQIKVAKKLVGYSRPIILDSGSPDDRTFDCSPLP